jgi:hypothetical protein
MNKQYSLTSETLANFYQTTRRYNPEDCHHLRLITAEHENQQYKKIYTNDVKDQEIINVSACVEDAPRFLGQEFGNNKSYIIRSRFYLYESKIFAALWLSLAAFTVICQ